jgi:N-acetylglucosaminyl-diphospho-decaprenol L-rhamnosyltransferase
MTCLAALAKERASLPALRAIVVDGSSDDGSVEKISQALSLPDYADWAELLPLSFNGGFGWANNQAILTLWLREDEPEFIFLINPDAEIARGALHRLVGFLLGKPNAAAVGSALLEPDGQRTGSAFRFPSIGREFLRGIQTPLIGRLIGIKSTTIVSDVACRADWVTGASVLFRSSALRETGPFDDGFFLYFEEVELMNRLTKAGWEIWHEPASQVTHIGGAATGIASGHVTTKKRHPAYWFSSRRRYFALCYGRLSTFFAGMAWLVGHIFWRIRTWLQPSKAGTDVPFERVDFVAHGLFPSAKDLLRSVPKPESSSRKLPAWCIIE